MSKSTSVDELVENFVQKLTSVLEQETETRARDAVMSAFGAAPRAPRAPRAILKPRRKVSPHLKLAGRYMGLMKTMKISERKQIKAVRVTKGVEAAIELMTQIQAARA